MGRHACILLLSCLLSLSIPWTGSHRAAAGEDEASVYGFVADVLPTDGSWSFRHELEVPVKWLADGLPPGGGRASVAFAHGRDGPHWDGAAEASVGPLSFGLFYGRPHVSSKDPFKIVHSSARSEGSVAGLLRWRGSAEAEVQFVNEVPLRRNLGSLVAGGLRWPGGGSLHVAAYGSETVRHVFATVDGSLSVDRRPLQWGVAWMEGVEVDGTGAGQPVADGALFVRGEWSLGAHGGWWRLHATGPNFRSLAADSYPFARGKVGLEGRWQWRAGTGTLISAFARRLQAIEGPSRYETDLEGEISFSSMPRGRWGRRLTTEVKSGEDGVRSFAVEGFVTHPSRRLEIAAQVGSRNGGPLHWRYRLQWEGDGWRLRLSVDEAYGGWRAEGRGGDDGPWGWTVVYKQRDRAKGSPSHWLHAELRRQLGRVEAWVRFMEPDLGRIDVGWARPPTGAVGFRMSF